MFEEPKLKDLSKFLSIDSDDSFSSVKFNDSPSISLPKRLKKDCRDFYSEVYDYCYAEFPQTRKLWLEK